MIVIKGRLMMIGNQDQVVAWSGDNLVEVRVFELPRYYNNIDMWDFDFKLNTEINGVKNIIDLPKTVVDEDSIILVWTIAESHVTIPGRMFIQIRAFSADEEKWHSSQDYVFVQSSINATDVIPDPLPSEFEQMEVRVTAAKNESLEAAQTAEEQADIATTKAGGASDSADAALGSEQAALGYRNQAQGFADDAEESAEESAKSAQIAANNILNGVDTHNQADTSHADIRDEIRTVEAIARGKATAFVFETYTDMMEWLEDPENTAQLVVGDNLYIKDVDVFDYWWTGTDVSPLEAEAPDLTAHKASGDHDGRYYTEAEVDLIVSDLLSTLKNRGICFSISTVELATTQIIPLTAPFDMTIIGGKMTVETAPTDADLICDIHKNGTTLWSTQANRPRIVAGQYSGNITTPNITTITQGDLLLFMVDQVGALVPGRDLSLTLYCEVA